MKTHNSRLFYNMGISAFALLAASAAHAQTPSPVPDQVSATNANPGTKSAQAGGDAEAADEIIVTGTSIRGVAPVGSNLVSATREDLTKTAAISVGELTNTVPSITQSGSAPVGQNTFSYYAPSIHGIGGSASSTTLVLVDGLRMPGGGVQFAQPDPNIIPTSAVQRVEVLAEGASSVYGSDAVAGVVNYITRRKFDGVEASGKYGWADKWSSRDFNFIVGKSWDTGSVYFAGQYAYQSSLANNARDFLSRGDYRSQGGQNLQTFNCSPATIRTPSSGTNLYLSPSATSTSSSASANAPCNNTIYGDALPSSDRKTGMVRITQDIGDRLTLTGTAIYNHLYSELHQVPGNVSAITAFGPGSGRGGQINPFYRAPAGDPTATQEIVNWVALRPGNDYGRMTTDNDTIYAIGTAEYKFGGDWIGTFSNAFGRSRSSQNRINEFCSSCAVLAINGTILAGGNTAASGIAGSGVTVLNLPLTTANALDVWAANGGATSASVLQRLYSRNERQTHFNTFNQTKLEFGGSLAHLPAGNLRVAVGGEYLWTKQDVSVTDTSVLGSVNGLSTFFDYTLKRDVYSGYVELFAPLISEDMGVPLVKSLNLNLSGRYDRYSDVGSTTNPKVALEWEVTNGIKLRGNWATAFVAPPLNAIGIPSLGYRRNSTGTSVDTTLLNLPVALYPGLTSIPGCTTATVTCQVGGSSSIQGLTRSYGVGPGAKNQTGNSWSIGVDFAPAVLPNFRSSVTFWSTRLKQGVDSLGITYQINIPQLNRITVCPSGCSADQINTFINSANGGSLTSELPSTVYFLRNQDLGNVVNLTVQGIDFSAEYTIRTGSAGDFTLGAAGTYFTKFDQDYPGLKFSLLGTSGSNQTYPSVQGRYRFHGGWVKGPFSLDAFVNYTTSYRNWSALSAIPVQTTPQGALVGGGDKVKANTTVDLNVQYNFGERFGGTTLFLDVKNLFDTDPPFYSGNTGGRAVGGNGYNGFLSNPLGRIISVGFRAGF